MAIASSSMAAGVLVGAARLVIAQPSLGVIDVASGRSHGAANAWLGTCSACSV